MFTGIIENTGRVKTLYKKKDGHKLLIYAENGFDSVRKGSSIAVNGVCLTVIEAKKGSLTFDVMDETFRTTAFSFLRCGEEVNLEKTLEATSRLDGHFVLGHVDGREKIKSINKGMHPYIEITISPEGIKYVVKKGSVAIDGISLTVSAVYPKSIRVDIIPYTLEHTNLKHKKNGDWINVEYDILGKYIENSAEKSSEIRKSRFTEDFLKTHGFI